MRRRPVVRDRVTQNRARAECGGGDERLRRVHLGMIDAVLTGHDPQTPAGLSQLSLGLQALSLRELSGG
jgi:hypothetical protein